MTLLTSVRSETDRPLTMCNTRAIQLRRRGFTLIELLVVIGIIAALAALLLPMILKTMKQGSRTRTQADLNSVAIALEAYKADFGDYPRLPVYTSGPDVGKPIADTGAAVLGKALVGPYGDGLTST